MSSTYLYPQWLTELRAQAQADFKKSADAYAGLSNKTTAYARSIAAIRDLRYQALVLFNAAPDDLPGFNSAAPVARSFTARVIKVVANQLAKEPAEVTAEKTFEQLDGDSLDQIEMIIALEDEFGIEIPDHAAEHIVSVQTAIDYVTGRAA